MPISVDQANELVSPFLPGVFGFTFTEVSPGFSSCRVQVTPRMLNPVGILHGGIPYSLADTGMAIALLAMLDEGQLRFSTLEIKVSYFATVIDGEVVCDTKVVRKGNRVAFLESDVRQGETLVARATGTYYIASGK